VDGLENQLRDHLDRHAQFVISLTRLYIKIVQSVLAEKTALRLIAIPPKVTGKDMIETVRYVRNLTKEY